MYYAHRPRGSAGVAFAHAAGPERVVDDLIRRYLGATRRAGRGALAHGTPSGEDAVMVAAGFSDPHRVRVAGRVHERSDDDIVASVFSLSRAAPHLFGERIHEFECDLRRLLRHSSPERRFAERAREIELVIWAK
jgi:hypothetical protein